MSGPVGANTLERLPRKTPICNANPKTYTIEKDKLKSNGIYKAPTI